MHFAKEGETAGECSERDKERQKGRERKSGQFSEVHEVIMPLRRSDKQCNAATC